MGTYQITTDKGTYQVETDAGQSANQAPDQATANVNTALNDLAGTSTSQSATLTKPMSAKDQVMSDIAQFGKSAYSVTPFARRIAQLTGSGADEIYANVGKPQGVLQEISSMAGELAPQIAMATPFMRGANVLMASAADAAKGIVPGIAGKVTAGAIGSAPIRGALGLGTYSGAKTALQGGNGQEISDSTTDGMTQGLIYGALGKLGASVVPEKVLGKYAQTIGSSVGGAIAGALTAPSGDKMTSSAILMGALSALTPEERIDFHKMISNNVTQPQMEKYLREGLQIPEADTKTILDNGMNEIERVGTMQIPVPNELGGQDILTPVQISQKFYQSGIQAIRQKLSTQFDEAIKSNEATKPEDIGKFVNDLKSQVDNYADPTSPIVRRFNTTYNALQGFEPTTTETENLATKEQPPGLRPNVRQVTMGELPKNIQSQVRQQLGQTKDITNLTLNSLHELKQNLYDAVSDKTWRDPGNTTPEERFAKSLGNQIGQYIGQKNSSYQKAASEWAKMKGVQADIMGLNTNNLGRDWARLDPANKVDMINTLNGISTYFKGKGVGQFDPKGLLDKYHAYNAINNPDPASFRNNAPLKIAFERGGTILGGLLGLPFGGAHTAAIGSAIGYMTAIKYMRPQTYISILKQMKPNLKNPESMTHQEATDTLQKLIAKKP